MTQDATPTPGWLAAYRAAFALDERAGAAYGPHLARPETSPMIARELESFFASFSPDGNPVVQRAGDPTFLSNVNACYLRACWEEVRFRELDYSEDQAFGTDMLAAGWSKVYQPGAAVLHAHDYGPIEFMRRYFDEYRGLRETSGHVEPFAIAALLGYVARETTADRRWLAERGAGRLLQARWTARASVHHTGRRVFSALGSRAERIPAPLRAHLSLERRAGAASANGAESAGGADGERFRAGDADGAQAGRAGATEAGSEGRWLRPPRSHRRRPSGAQAPRGLRRDRARLARGTRAAARSRARYVRARPPADRDGDPVVPTRERRAQHAASDPYAARAARPYLQPLAARLHRSALLGVERGRARRRTQVLRPAAGTGLQGLRRVARGRCRDRDRLADRAPTLLLDNCRARAYVVNDHEPEFYPTSTDFLLAQDSYRYGLHCIAASPWLRDLLIERYGVSADAFELGVEHEPTGRKRSLAGATRSSTTRATRPPGGQSPWG